MKNLPFAVRGIIVLIVDFVFLWLLLDNKIDGLVNYGIAYLWAIGCAILTHGLLYGVFVGKKAIEATKKQLSSSDAESRKRAKWYWLMQGLMAIAFIGVTVLKHIEISQMKPVVIDYSTLKMEVIDLSEDTSANKPLILSHYDSTITIIQ